MFRLIAIVCLATACLASPLHETRVIGGQFTTIKDHPFQLSLQNNDVHICGAVIISPSWALTAAHCSAGSVGSITLRAGTTIREAGGAVYQVFQKIVHTQFNIGTSDYDIALLRIQDTFDFVPGVATIPLPDQDESVADGANATLSGWGLTEEGSIIPLPHILRAVNITVISQDDCQASYGISAITPRMFCAGLLEGGKDACLGDYGGPLVSGGKLIGITSWGEGCARPNRPHVYTRLASMRDWIKTNSGV